MDLFTGRVFASQEGYGYTRDVSLSNDTYAKEAAIPCFHLLVDNINTK